MNLFHQRQQKQQQQQQAQQQQGTQPSQQSQQEQQATQLSSTANAQSVVATQAEQQQQQRQYPLPQQNQFQVQESNTNQFQNQQMQTTQNGFNPLLAAMQNPNIMALLSSTSSGQTTVGANPATQGGLEQLLALIQQQQPPTQAQQQQDQLTTPSETATSETDSHIDAASQLLASKPNKADVATPAAVTSAQAPAHPNPGIASTKAPVLPTAAATQRASSVTAANRVVVGPRDGDKGSRSVIPCRARGMPMDHNFKTAYFIVEEGTPHGAQLVCTYPLCRNGGTKFRWCHSCKAPVAKRNFKNRHGHTEELGSAANNVPIDVSDAVPYNQDICHPINVGSGNDKPVVGVNAPAGPKQDKVDEASNNHPEGAVRHPKQQAKEPKKNDRRDPARAIDPSVGQPRHSGATPTARQHAWASLLSQRPTMTEGDQVSAWLMKVLSVSDPEAVLPQGPFAIPDGSVSGGTRAIYPDSRNGRQTSESTLTSGHHPQNREQSGSTSSDRSPSGGDSCGTDMCSSTESLSPSTSGRSDESSEDNQGKCNDNQLPKFGRKAEGVRSQSNQENKRKAAQQTGAAKKQKGTE